MIRIEVPFPTLQQLPFFSKGWAANKLFHTKELLGTSDASKKQLRGKYLALKHPHTKESSSCISHHPCLANIARLKFHRSQNPIPSSFLGFVSAFELFQWIFLSLPIWPHQNLAHIAFRSLQSFTGRRRTPIVYVGIDCATTLIRTSFPALDNICPFQP